MLQKSQFEDRSLSPPENTQASPLTSNNPAKLLQSALAISQSAAGSTRHEPIDELSY